MRKPGGLREKKLWLDPKKPLSEIGFFKFSWLTYQKAQINKPLKKITKKFEL